ncbi:MAG: hypothetical protein GX418_13855 [Clostridiales bacterium]|nr:hypothetical protein [Clostridiales bacterium]
MPQQTKPKVPEVVKPGLTGSWHGRDAVRLGLRMMLNILFVSLLYLILSLLLSFDSVALRVLAGLMLVLAAGTYLYYGGMNAGQSDAAFGEIMYQRRQEGHAVSPADENRCFHPAKGFFAASLGALPYCLIALVFAFLAQPSTYTLGVLPTWMTSYTRQSGIGDALAYYQSHEGISVAAVLRILVRSMTMPFINVAVKLGVDATLWAERLSPLWVLIAPLGYGFGYAQGLALRRKINTGILIGDQRKKRRERRERKARARRNTPERLI